MYLFIIVDLRIHSRYFVVIMQILVFINSSLNSQPEKWQAWNLKETKLESFKVFLLEIFLCKIIVDEHS